MYKTLNKTFFWIRNPKKHARKHPENCSNNISNEFKVTNQQKRTCFSCRVRQMDYNFKHWHFSMPLFKWNTTGQVISNNFLAKQWRVTLNIDQKKVKNPRGFPVVEISQKKKWNGNMKKKLWRKSQVTNCNTSLAQQYSIRLYNSLAIGQKGESHNGSYKKIKHAKFSKKQTFGMLCFLITPILSFALLPNYRQI